MESRQFRMHDGQKGAALAIRVTPRARHNEVVEILNDGSVKIRLTAPPVEGKANQALVEFLAEVLDVPRSNIEIVAGHSGRDKLVSILGVDAAYVQGRILRNMSE